MTGHDPGIGGRITTIVTELMLAFLASELVMRLRHKRECRASAGV